MSAGMKTKRDNRPVLNVYRGRRSRIDVGPGAAETAAQTAAAKRARTSGRRRVKSGRNAHLRKAADLQSAVPTSEMRDRRNVEATTTTIIDSDCDDDDERFCGGGGGGGAAAAAMKGRVT